MAAGAMGTSPAIPQPTGSLDAADRARLSAAEGVVALDPIVIDTRPGGLSGHEARERLFKENRVHLEMSTASVIVAVLGAGAALDVERFLDALHALPEIGHRQLGPDTLPSPGPRAMSIRKAFFSSTEDLRPPAARSSASA